MGDNKFRNAKKIVSVVQFKKIGNKSTCNKQNIAEVFNTFILFVVNEIIKHKTQAH